MLAFAAERGEAFAKVNRTACWLGRKPPAELANHGYFQRQRRKCFGMLVQQVRTCSPPFRCRQDSRVISADEHRIDPAALVSAERGRPARALKRRGFRPTSWACRFTRPDARRHAGTSAVATVRHHEQVKRCPAPRRDHRPSLQARTCDFRAREIIGARPSVRSRGAGQRKDAPRVASSPTTSSARCGRTRPGDFTINALYYDPQTQELLRLSTAAFEDLAAKRLRDR